MSDGFGGVVSINYNEKICENIFGVNLNMGKISPVKNHLAEIFYIVEHTGDKAFAEKEALQMLLQFGQTNYFFYGKYGQLWHLKFDEADIKLNSAKDTAANTIDCNELDDLIDELTERKSLRYIVPCDYYLMYDDKEIYERVKRALL